MELWFEYEMSPAGACAWTLSLLQGALFCKVMEALGGGVTLKEMGLSLEG